MEHNYIPMEKIFKKINIETGQVVTITFRELTIFIRECNIGEKTKLSENNFLNESTANKFLEKQLLSFENKGFIEYNAQKHTSQILIKLKETVIDEDEFWNLLSIRDNIDEDIEEELYNYSFGEFIGASDIEIVYGIWNFKDTLEKAINIIKSKLIAYNLKEAVLRINGKEIT